MRRSSDFRDCGARGASIESDWNGRFERYAKATPAEAAEFKSMLAGELPAGWDADLPEFTPKDTLATRESASRAEQAIAKNVWNLFGGAADLNESTFTDVKDGGDFERHDYAGRNLHFGIREHGMCAILNGIALHGGFIPYGSSFLIFTDYCRPSIRLAALMGIHVIYVFTHDSIGARRRRSDASADRAALGPARDSESHRDSAGRRQRGGRSVARRDDASGRPGDAGVVRQKMPTLDRTAMAPARELARGAYVLTETKGRTPEIILMASGSELQLAVGRKAELEKRGHAVRVVSMPSMEMFEKQDAAYRDSVLPPTIRRRLAIEAGAPMSWYRWVGLEGDVVGMTTFGASGPSADVLKHFGFTVENMVDARAQAARATERTVAPEHA